MSSDAAVASRARKLDVFPVGNVAGLVTRRSELLGKTKVNHVNCVALKLFNQMCGLSVLDIVRNCLNDANNRYHMYKGKIVY